MPTCTRCGADHPTEELVRHEQDGMLFVHCPDCQHPFGVYNRRAERPRN